MKESFHVYLKKQLVEYIEAERKKGIPLEVIEKALFSAGHEKNIIDEALAELKKEELFGEKTKRKGFVEKDLAGMLKGGFAQFMSKAKGKEIGEAKEDLEKTGTDEIVKEAAEEAEIIEEKTMLEGFSFFIYLVALGLVVFFTAGLSGSEIASVAIGFSPAIINAFASFLALKLADNVPLYMFIPLAICSAFYALGKFAHLALFGKMDMEALSLVNFVLALLFNIMIVYVRFVKPAHMKRRVMKKSPIPVPSVPSETEQKQRTEKKDIGELKKEFGIR